MDDTVTLSQIYDVLTRILDFIYPAFIVLCFGVGFIGGRR